MRPAPRIIMTAPFLMQQTDALIDASLDSPKGGCEMMQEGRDQFPCMGVSAERTANRWSRLGALRAPSLWAAAALFFLCVSPASAADFPSIVANVLNSQTDGRIAKLDPATKQEMVNCVNGVLAGLPNGKKKFVVEGANYGEQESRFGKVVKENRAEWEQKIAKGCGQIAMRGSKGIGHQ